ncbi:MAG: FumA C-terminus/TtdB family hydratase beta subunit [Clostridiales bacterium]|nr:FumA C-terminus/TtdB family hydratase beta subunit [Clostridiales bacterium]
MNTYSVNVNDCNFDTEILKAGDMVRLNGTVFTARDAAHKKIFSLINAGKELPFDLKNAAVYYAGPTPNKPGSVIGSCGPTTSGRMDIYTPTLIDMGLKYIIGKGDRSESVYQAIMRNSAVYFCAVGGAGALYSKHIVSCEVIAFEELGCESVKRITVSDFPVFVGIDSFGGSIYLK